MNIGRVAYAVAVGAVIAAAIIYGIVRLVRYARARWFVERND